MHQKIESIIYTIILGLICFIWIIPYQVMIIGCFSTSESIKGNLLFTDISLDNFVQNIFVVSQEQYFISSLVNSFVVSICAALIGVFIASMAGYAYSIYSNRLHRVLFLISFGTIMIPSVVILIPTFLIFKYINLLDTYLAVILTSLSIPFLIYLFKQNTSLFPKELIAAARLDGLCEFSIYLKIYLPYMKQVYIAAIMLSFFNAWNSILLPVVILQSQSKFTNAIYLNSLGSFWSADYAVMMLEILLSTLPSIILYLIFQKYIKNILKI